MSSLRVHRLQRVRHNQRPMRLEDYLRRRHRHLHSLPRARQFSKGITNRDKECHISGAQEAEALTPAQSPREVPFGMSTYELTQTVEGPTFGGDGHVV